MTIGSEFWFLSTPAFLLFLLLIPLIYLSFYSEKTRRLRLSLFNLTTSRRRTWHLLLPGLIVAFYVLALTRPYFGFRELELQVSGRDIFVIQDISRSMLTKDTAPTRLEFSKRKIEDLLRILRAQKSSDRVGLILFAGSSYLYCPPTEDLSVVSIFVRSIAADMISSLGSNLSEAIKVAAQSIKQLKSKNPVLILLSDGEDKQLEVQKAMAHLQPNELRLNAIGIGSAQGQPIEVANGRFVKDRQGQTVISKLEESSLRQLALKSGGTYVRASLDDSDLISILHSAPAPETAPESIKKVRAYNEFGPLLLWIPLLLIALCYVGKRSELVFTLALLLSFSRLASAEQTAQQIETFSARQAYEAYLQGDFKRAEQGFAQALSQDPENLELLQALASTRYKLGQYEQASELYNSLAEKSSRLQNPADVRHHFHARYDLGNSQFKIKNYEKAIENYEQALKLKPQDEKALHNLDLARKLLEQKKQEQQSQDQQQQQEQEKNKQDQDSQPNQQETPGTPTPDPSASPQASAQPTSNSASPKDSSTPEQQKKQPKPAEQKQQENQNQDKRDNQAGNGAAGRKHDDKELGEREAETWLQSLQDDPVLLQRHRKSQASNPEQTW